MACFRRSLRRVRTRKKTTTVTIPLKPTSCIRVCTYLSLIKSRNNIQTLPAPRIPPKLTPSKPFPSQPNPTKPPPHTIRKMQGSSWWRTRYPSGPPETGAARVAQTTPANCQVQKISDLADKTRSKMSIWSRLICLKILRCS